jgi:histidyl-tRNA synthetase
MLPRITDHLGPECSEHFNQVKEFLTVAGIGYEIVPRLVRGLDYYVRTAFEIVSGELGAQNALVGGGRYDGLSEILGGPRAPGFGFAMGVDRLVMILPAQVCAEIGYRPDVFVAYLGDAAFKRALTVARALRGEGRICHLEFVDGSLKSQLRLAHKIGARHVLIIGDEELARERYQVRRMHDSKQWEMTLPELLSYLAGKSADLDI